MIIIKYFFILKFYSFLRKNTERPPRIGIMKSKLIADSIPIWSASTPNGHAARALTAKESPITSEDAVPACLGAALWASMMFTGIVDARTPMPNKSKAVESMPDVYRNAYRRGDALRSVIAITFLRPCMSERYPPRNIPIIPAKSVAERMKALVL